MASTKDERISEIITSRYKALKSDQDPIFQEVEEYRQMYHSYMDQSSAYPWDFQYVDPMIFPLLRAHLSRLNPQEASIQLESRNGKNRESAQVNQQVVNWELGEILKTQIFYRNMFTGFLAGKGYLKTGWLYEPGIVIKDGKRQVELRDVINRADLQNVRFTDMFIPNRNIPEISEQPYTIERVSMTYGKMWDMAETTDYWDKKLLEEIKKKGLFTTKVEFGTDLPNVDTSKSKLAVRSQYVNMLCMTTSDGDELYILENGAIEAPLNTEQGNQYWHDHSKYLDFTPFPEDDEFFSMGIVQPVADLQMAMSSVLNQLLTAARKAGNPMWIAGRQASQTPDWAFVNRPDGVLRVAGDVNQIQQVKTTDTSGTLINLRGELNTSFDQGTSISSLYRSGAATNPSVNKTATGAKIIDQNIDINLQLLVALYGAQILKRAGEHFLELNAQYITEEQTFRITGKRGQSDYVTVKPEQVSANFDVIASPDRMIKQSPALRQAGLLNLFTTLSQAKKEGVPINLKPVVEATIDAFPETENIDNIMIDPEATADDAISSITRGYDPDPVTWDDDHKAIIQIVQRYLIDNQEKVNNQQMTKFVEYLEDCQSWIKAKNPQLVTGGGVGQPEMQPMSEEGIAQSFAQDQSMGMNPTQGLPIQMNQEQLGIV